MLEAWHQRIIGGWQALRRGLAAPQLVRTTLLTMTLRVALVVLVSALFSYLFLVEQTEHQVQDQLGKYVAERSKREAEVFRLAVDRHRLLKQAMFQAPVIGASPPVPKLYPWPDGTRRNFPPDQPLTAFDSQGQASIILGRDWPGGAALEQRLARFNQLLMQYGPAWRDRFTDTFIIVPENAALLYWPEVAGALMVPGDFDVRTEKFFYTADLAHDPQRSTAWTDVYHDPASPDWIVSVVTPIDGPDGQPFATVGHDLILTELIQRTNEDRLQGTYNLIFSPAGQLIVHPEFGDQIQAQNGELKIQDLNDPHLNRIFEQVIQQVAARGAAPPVVNNAADGEFLGVARLDGPGWYFLTVYPKALLNQRASAAARFVLFSGLLSLGMEVVLLYNVLCRRVAEPLEELLQATEQIAQGDFSQHPEPLPSGAAASLELGDRPDEIGQLSRAFGTMAVQLRTLFATLEQRIEDRTAQLQQANRELERLSRRDSLTQLANRRSFDAHLAQEWKRQQREHQPLSLLLCDIDCFKAYNDHYGHPTGDDCLQAVARIIQATAQRPADLAARYGGEEFAVILPETDEAGAMALAQSLGDRLRQAQLPHKTSTVQPWITLSVGIATSDKLTLLTPEQLLAAADRALYQAKQAGRDRACQAPCAIAPAIAPATQHP